MMLFSVLSAPPIVVIQSAYETYFRPDQQDEAIVGADSQNLVFTIGRDCVVDDKAVGWQQFSALVEAWKAQRGAMSSVTESVLCPAYQSIIGMGEKAVPFLLRQLSNEGDDPDQWFWALKAITGVDPVREEDLGNNLRMAQAWLEWGDQSGVW